MNITQKSFNINQTIIVILTAIASIVLAPTHTLLSSAQAIEYYVDQSGKDDNDGTNSGTPWQTIEKVNNTVFSGGDTVRFKCGGVWHGRLVVSSSGGDGNPITFTSYGLGEKPRIAATIVLGANFEQGKDGETPYWSISQTQANTYKMTLGYDPFALYTYQYGKLRASIRGGDCNSLEDRQWCYNETNGSLYIRIYSGEQVFPELRMEVPRKNWGNAVNIAGRSNIVIDGLAVIGGRRYTTGTNDGSGIVISDNSSNCVIRNCSLLGGPTSGIKIIESHDIAVSHNEIYDCGNSGIYVSRGSTRCTIEHNEVYNCGNYYMSFESPKTVMDKGGISIGRANDVKILDNSIHECGLIHGQTTDPAIEVYCSMKVILANNHIYDNYFAALRIEGDDLIHPDTEVTHNLIVNNQRNNEKARAVVSYFKTANASFIGNTYCNNYVPIGYGGIMLEGDNTNLRILSNEACDAPAFHWNERLLHVPSSNSNPGLIMDYNNWYRPAGARFIHFDKQEFGHDQFKQYQLLTGKDLHSRNIPCAVLTAPRNLRVSP